DGAAAVEQGRAAVGLDADEVVLQHVAGRAGAVGRDTVAGIGADQVSSDGGGPADGVAVCLAVDGDAISGIGQSSGAGGVGADVVACDDDAGSARAEDSDTVTAAAADGGIAADDVAGAGGGAADGVAARGNHDAFAVAQRE